MRPLRLRIKGVMPHLASSSGGVKLTWKLYFKETLARKWGKEKDERRPAKLYLGGNSIYEKPAGALTQNHGACVLEGRSPS